LAGPSLRASRQSLRRGRLLRAMPKRKEPDAKTRIDSLVVRDIRFPTSDFLDGSDAIHTDPDYSCAYVILKTSVAGLDGHGLTFSLGRGNEVIAACCRAYAPFVVGRFLEDIAGDMMGLYHALVNEQQLRWLGPEKGVSHMACGAILNAVWDLLAKQAGKPLWKYIVDLTPEQLVECIDFKYISDVLTKAEALEMLQAKRPGVAAREEEMRRDGFPAYTTSAGWLGYSDEKIRALCQEYIAQGLNHFKMKVGANLEDDIRRARVMREAIGPDRKLMMDANQRWEVSEAIENMKKLAFANPWWIEEPTCPDDILGHAAIARAIAPIGVATGEVAQNKVIFKQLLQSKAIKFCQIDSCRVAGPSEILAILLMSAKMGVAVCPHAGGVGLNEYVRHLAMIDYIIISGTLEDRVCESTSHLHEHFYDPVDVSGGTYKVATRAGYAEMKRESMDEFGFPTGSLWVKRLATSGEKAKP